MAQAFSCAGVKPEGEAIFNGWNKNLKPWLTDGKLKIVTKFAEQRKKYWINHDKEKGWNTLRWLFLKAIFGTIETAKENGRKWTIIVVEANETQYLTRRSGLGIWIRKNFRQQKIFIFKNAKGIELYRETCFRICLLSCSKSKREKPNKQKWALDHVENSWHEDFLVQLIYSIYNDWVMFLFCFPFLRWWYWTWDNTSKSKSTYWMKEQ